MRNSSDCIEPLQEKVFTGFLHLKESVACFKDSLNRKNEIVEDLKQRIKNVLVEYKEMKSKSNKESELSTGSNINLYKTISELQREKEELLKKLSSHEKSFELANLRGEVSRSNRFIEHELGNNLYSSKQKQRGYSQPRDEDLIKVKQNLVKKVDVLNKALDDTKKYYEEKIVVFNMKDNQPSKLLLEVKAYIKDFISTMKDLEKAVITQDTVNTPRLHTEFNKSKEQLIRFHNDLDALFSSTEEASKFPYKPSLEKPEEQQIADKSKVLPSSYYEKELKTLKMKYDARKKEEQKLSTKIKQLEAKLVRQKSPTRLSKRGYLITKQRIFNAIKNSERNYDKKLKEVELKAMTQLKHINSVTEKAKKFMEASFISKTSNVPFDKIAKLEESNESLKHSIKRLEKENKHLKQSIELQKETGRRSEKLEAQIKDMEKTMNKYKEDAIRSIKQNITRDSLLRKSQLQIEQLTKDFEKASGQARRYKDAVQCVEALFSNEMESHKESANAKLNELDNGIRKLMPLIKGIIEKYRAQKYLPNNQHSRIIEDLRVKEDIQEVIVKVATAILNNKMSDAVNLHKNRLLSLEATIITFQKHFLTFNEQILDLQTTNKDLERKLQSKILRSNSALIEMKLTSRHKILNCAKTVNKATISIKEIMIGQIQDNIEKSVVRLNKKIDDIRNATTLKDSRIFQDKITITKLEGEVAKLKRDLVESETQRENYVKTSKAEKDQMITEMSVRPTKLLEESKKELNKLNKEFENVKNELDNKSRVLAKTNELAEQLKVKANALQQQNAGLTESNKKLMKELEAMKASFKHTLNKAKTSLTAAKNGIFNEGKKRIMNCLNNILTNYKVQKRLIELKSRNNELVQKLKASIEAIKKQLITVKEEHDESLKQKNSAESRFTEQQELINSLESKLNQMRTSNTALAKSISKLKPLFKDGFEEITNVMEESFDERMNSLNGLQEKFYLIKEFERLTNEKYLNIIEEKEIIIKDQKNQLEAAERIVLKIPAEIEKKNNEKRELEEKLAEKNKQILGLNKDLENYKAAMHGDKEKARLVQELEVKLRNQDSIIEKYKTTLNDLKKAEANLQHSNDMANEYKTALQKLRVEVKDAKRSLRDFKTEFAGRVSEAVIQTMDSTGIWKRRFDVMANKIAKLSKLSREKKAKFKKLVGRVESIIKDKMILSKERMSKQLEVLDKKYSKLNDKVFTLAKSNKELLKRKASEMKENYKEKAIMSANKQYNNFSSQIQLITINYSEFQTSIKEKLIRGLNQLKGLEEKIQVVSKMKANNNNSEEMDKLKLENEELKKEIDEMNYLSNEKDNEIEQINYQIRMLTESHSTETNSLEEYKEKVNKTIEFFKEGISEMKYTKIILLASLDTSLKGMQNLIKKSQEKIRGMMCISSIMESKLEENIEKTSHTNQLESVNKGLQKTLESVTKDLVASKNSLKELSKSENAKQSDIERLTNELDATKKNLELQIKANRELSEFYINRFKDLQEQADQKELELKTDLEELANENSLLNKRLETNSVCKGNDELKPFLKNSLEALMKKYKAFAEEVNTKLQRRDNLFEEIRIKIDKLMVESSRSWLNMQEGDKGKIEDLVNECAILKANCDTATKELELAQEGNAELSKELANLRCVEDSKDNKSNNGSNDPRFPINKLSQKALIKDSLDKSFKSENDLSSSHNSNRSSNSVTSQKPPDFSPELVDTVSNHLTSLIIQCISLVPVKYCAL